GHVTGVQTCALPISVEAYRTALEPRLGTVYHRRKAFEESITLLNEAISSYLDLEEQAAQAMFPHYFEKQKTDGVDYSIYVGSSLIEEIGRESCRGGVELS